MQDLWSDLTALRSIASDRRRQYILCESPCQINDQKPAISLGQGIATNLKPSRDKSVIKKVSFPYEKTELGGNTYKLRAVLERGLPMLILGGSFLETCFSRLFFETTGFVKCT